MRSDRNTRQRNALIDPRLGTQIDQHCDEVSDVMRSLSHPVRLKILSQLLEGEKTVAQLTEWCGISQSSMSQFLARLKEEKIVLCRRDGHFRRYQIGDERLVELLRQVRRIYCD